MIGEEATVQTKDIQDDLKRERFQPFKLHLDDGRVVRVSHREAVAFVPSGRSVVVMDPDEYTQRLGEFHIVSIDDRDEHEEPASRRESA